MINKSLLLLSSLLLIAGCSFSSSEPPKFLLGDFQDDYNIQYEITKDLWFQKPDAKFHIVEWNLEEQYLIARNDSLNPSEAGLYTRFDWMKFDNMAAYKWGFCMTTYKAETIQEAKSVGPPNRESPIDGCNGFPFSRMK